MTLMAALGPVPMVSLAQTPWQTDEVTGEQYADRAEACGSGWWAFGHAWAQTIHDDGCATCGVTAIAGMIALHDLVNLDLGKPLHDRENFERMAARYGAALESVQPASAPAAQDEVVDLSAPVPFGWPGSKHAIAHWMVDLVPVHRTYVEPFAGAAALFWHKQPAKVEVLADVDPDVARFYKQLQGLDACDIAGLAEDFALLRAKAGHQDACTFLANTLCSYGMKREHHVDRPTCWNNAPAFHRHLDHFRERMASVTVIEGDWERVVLDHDSPETFFYLDPPYRGSSQPYAFGEDQLDRLAQVLPRLKGKWLLSYADHPDVVAAFRGFETLAIDVPSGMAQQKHAARRELLIANYPLRARRTRVALAAQSAIERLGDAFLGGIGFGLAGHVTKNLLANVLPDATVPAGAASHLQEEAQKLDVSGLGDFIRERIQDPSLFAPDSFRTLDQDEHRLLVACLPDQWSNGECAHSQAVTAILHPRSEQAALIEEARRRGLPIVDDELAKVEAMAAAGSTEAPVYADRGGQVLEDLVELRDVVRIRG